MTKKLHIVTIKEDYRGRQAAFYDDVDPGVDILSSSGVVYGGVYDSPGIPKHLRMWRPYIVKKIYIFNTKKEQMQVFRDFNEMITKKHESIWQD